jgi:hypothetical protein
VKGGKASSVARQGPSAESNKKNVKKNAQRNSLYNWLNEKKEVECRYCGRMGHKQIKCWDRKKAERKAKLRMKHIEMQDEGNKESNEESDAESVDRTWMMPMCTTILTTDTDDAAECNEVAKNVVNEATDAANNEVVENVSNEETTNENDNKGDKITKDNKNDEITEDNEDGEITDDSINEDETENSNEEDKTDNNNDDEIDDNNEGTRRPRRTRRRRI